MGEEMQEAEQRFWGDARLLRSYAAEHPDTFAGLWWIGESYRMAFTNPEAHRRAVVRLVRHPDTDLIRADRPLAQLEALVGRIRKDFEAGKWAPWDYHGIGIDEVGNTVDIGLHPDALGVAPRMKAEYGDHVWIGVDIMPFPGEGATD